MAEVKTDRTQLPPGYEYRGAAVEQNSEDCMGNNIHYWAQDAQTPDKMKCFIGTGASLSDACNAVIISCWRHYDFQQLSDKEKLEKFITAAMKNGRFYDVDLVEIIKILAKHVS